MGSDDQIDEIFRNVGLALHNGSRVEGAVISVLWRCMQTRTPAPATIVWGNVVNLGQKLSIVRQMIPLLIGDAEAQELWETISEAIQKRSRSRNNLAHYEVVQFEDGPRLVPKHQSADMGKLAHADTGPENALQRLLENFEVKGYTAKDILTIADNFSELKAAVQWYYSWVVEFKRVPHDIGLDDVPPLISDFLTKRSSSG